MEVGELEGVHTVQADQGARTATITFSEPVTESEIKALLVEINYPIVE
jgi:copper chaperone CopZ